MMIRLASLYDADAIAKVALSLGYRSEENSVLASQRLSRLFSSENDQVWVAEKEGNVIGWLHAQHAFRAASPDFIEILGLSVLSEARQQGIGRSLVEEAKLWATQKNVTLRVRTNETRDTARRFYSALGFSQAKTQTVYEIAFS